MPDAQYVNRKWSQALPPDAYAMISRSVGLYAGLLFMNRMAVRSTPMMGINRSKLSCRTFLFLFVLLGAPMAARCDTLEDSARVLARKIVASTSARTGVSIGVQNSSALKPEEITRIEQALKAELQSRGMGTSESRFEDAMVAITLSESLRSFVWTAEIRTSDANKVVLTMVPRPPRNYAGSNAMSVTLHDEKFWEGPNHVLDATIVNSPKGDSILLLLTPDELLIRKVESDAGSAVQIPRTELVTRDPAGTLAQSEGRVIVTSVSQICSIEPDSRVLIECHRAAGPAPGRGFEEIKFAPPVSTHVDRGDQTTTFQNSCGDAQIFLATGRGDYSESDTIQVVESAIERGKTVEKPLSDFLHVAGPVMALQSDGTMTRAIVRNLQTGNYEAYHISISCRQ